MIDNAVVWVFEGVFVIFEFEMFYGCFVIYSRG